MPGLAVVRPADANETAQAWAEILRRGRPAGLALSRQNLPDRRPHRARQGHRRRQGRLRAHRRGIGRRPTSSSSPPAPRSRSPSRRACASRSPASRTRVVSMPCREWFEEQPRSYQNKVLPPAVRARVSVEAGVAMGWHDLVGDAGRMHQHRALRCLGRRQDPVPRVRLHPRGRRQGRQGLPGRRPQQQRQVPSVTETAPRSRKDTGTDVRRQQGPEPQERGLGREVSTHDQHRPEGPRRPRRLRLARRPVARAPHLRQPPAAHRRQGRRRRHDEPVDLPGRPVRGPRLRHPGRASSRMPGRPSTRPCSPSPPQDVRDACDVFLPVYEATGGQDGRVSIEVDPRLAHDTAEDGRGGQGALRPPSTGRTSSSRSRRRSRACPPSPR